MATKQIAWTTGSGYITLTYNGLGNGTITVSSDDNTGVAREQIITIETTAGTPVVTKNITIRQEAYVPPILNFSYTGTVQSYTLPPGTYRLQCWGAQGSANDADATYGITSQAGGKGGYSEGILKLNSATTVYIFVGGQPTNADNHGGWNGGGGNYGTTSNGSETGTGAGFGYTKMGKGGGGTDIALVTSAMSWSTFKTERTDASLLSRFIVAGGGSGGAMAVKKNTTITTSWEKVSDTISLSSGHTGTWNGHNYSVQRSKLSSGTRQYVSLFRFDNGDCPLANGHYKAVWSGISEPSVSTRIFWSGSPVTDIAASTTATNVTEVTREFDFNYDSAPSSSHNLRFQLIAEGSYTTASLEIYQQTSTSTVNTTYESIVGYAGGGIEGEGYSSNYYGTQDSAGNGGAFGYGGSDPASVVRYCSPGGGGGWYGGGRVDTNSDNISYIKYSGGGSGFVNIPANAQYRPTGYTGIELDSGNTYVGNISNPSTTNGTFEIGHAGNGYARITRMGSWKAELPAGYTLLEYIENVNNAYINTGVNAADDIGIHIEYEDNYNYGSVSNYVCGARASSSSTILYAISGSSTNNTTLIAYNGTTTNLGVTRTQGKKYVVDLQADSTGLTYRYVIDGSEAKTGRITKTLSATSTPICLFGFNSSNIKKGTRISRCYMIAGGEVVRFFLPCKNASNVVGLYDCTNGVFYGSANSATFTAGPNIN